MYEFQLFNRHSQKRSLFKNFRKVIDFREFKKIMPKICHHISRS